MLSNGPSSREHFEELTAFIEAHFSETVQIGFDVGEGNSLVADATSNDSHHMLWVSPMDY